MDCGYAEFCCGNGMDCEYCGYANGCWYVAGIVVDTVEVAGFHNHILSILVQVGVDIVVEAKLAMALKGSKDFEVDRGNFVEEIVANSIEAS